MRKNHLLFIFFMATFFASLGSANAQVTLIGTATTNAGNTATSNTINVPSGTQAGDLMVAQIVSSEGSIGGPIGPTGWTFYSAQYAGNYRMGGIGVTQEIYYRLAGSSEPASYTWTAKEIHGYAPDAGQGGIVTYRGVNTSNPIDTDSLAGSHGSTAMTIPALTTAGPGEKLLTFYAGTNYWSGQTNTWTAPTGLTAEWDLSATNVYGVWFADQNVLAAGTSGAQTANQTVDIYWQGAMLALVPSVYFSTAASNASLPSDSTCASEIPTTPETLSCNSAMNQTAPTSTQLTAYRNGGYSWENLGDNMNDISQLEKVDGSYAGANISTEMIWRWSACKYGIDEEVVRAVAMNESGWLQQAAGDTRCLECNCDRASHNFCSIWDTIITEPNNVQINTTNPAACEQSWSAFQTKVWYEFMTWPEIMQSTAFGADYNQATTRECMNGSYAAYFANGSSCSNNSSQYCLDFNAYMMHPTMGSMYHTGYTNTTAMLYGCVGWHASGGWFDTGAVNYITQIDNILAQQSWETASCKSPMAPTCPTGESCTTMDICN